MIQTGKPIPASYDETSDQFMLAEYNRLQQLWQITDARTESTINLYLTLNGVALSGVVISAQGVSLSLFWVLTALLGVVITVSTQIMLRRVVGTQYTKKEYIHGLNLVRMYFLNKNPNLATYLSFFQNMPLAAPSNTSKILSYGIFPAWLRATANIGCGLALTHSSLVLISLIRSDLSVQFMGMVGIGLFIVYVALFQLINRQYRLKQIRFFNENLAASTQAIAEYQSDVLEKTLQPEMVGSADASGSA